MVLQKTERSEKDCVFLSLRLFENLNVVLRELRSEWNVETNNVGESESTRCFWGRVWGTRV